MTRLATRAAILGIFASGMMVGLSVGCSNDQVEIGRGEPGADAAPGSGGATDTGGILGTGGATQLGGATGSGGAMGTGGATQLGGSMGVGGVTGAGGATPTGGRTVTGGDSGVGGATVGTGGATPAGGNTGAGGSTGTQCGSVAGIQCTRAGQFCELTDGICRKASDGWGQCVDIPGVCGAVYAPVCGCDGSTYGSDCLRRSVGVSKDHDGPCQTADAGVRDAGTRPDTPAGAGRDGPAAIMTPTLPAPCTTSADCCVAMDICMATAYLVGKAEFDAMVASIESAHVPYTSGCLACVHPAVQVQCQAGFCVGELLSFYAEGTAFDNSHCGTIDTAPSDAGPTSLASAFSVTDGGTSPSKWGCGI